MVTSLSYPTIHQSPPWLGDSTTQRFSGFDPLLNDRFCVGHCFLVGFTIRHTTGQFRHLNDEHIVFITPVHDQLISNRHRVHLTWIITTAVSTPLIVIKFW